MTPSTCNKPPNYVRSGNRSHALSPARRVECSRYRCATAAFTLVELLVVILIVGVLLAIATSSLHHARQAARRVTCAAHLREVGRAWHGYLNENNGAFLKGTNRHWTYGGKDGRRPAYRRDRPLNVQFGLPTHGLRNARVFACPSDRGDIRPGVERYYDEFGTSYAMNPFLVGDRHVNEVSPFLRALNSRIGHLRVSSISAPPSKLILGGDGPWVHTWQNLHALTANWHQNRDRHNLLYFDGHVRLTKMELGKNIETGYTAVPFKSLAKLAREFPNEYQ